MLNQVTLCRIGLVYTKKYVVETIPATKTGQRKLSESDGKLYISVSQPDNCRGKLSEKGKGLF